VIGRPPSDGHVLVVRLDSLGDVLLAGPAVRAVARSARRVTMLVSPRGRPAAELLPGVDDLWEFDAPWISPEPEPATRTMIDRFVDDVSGDLPDTALILTSSHQDPLPMALLLRMAGVGTIAAISEDYPGSLLDVRHQVPDHLHEVQRALSLVEAAGYRSTDLDERLRISGTPGNPLGPGADEPYVVVHPGSSVPARTWPVDRFALAVGALAAAGHRVVVTGGPGEADAVRGAVGDAAADRAVTTVDTPTLGGLAQVIADADAIVVGNTGPAHLAAAVGTPVVSLFPPTVPASAWRPWQVPHVLLGEQDIGCAGCRARSCPFGSLQPCLATVNASDVVAAVADLRDQAHGRRDDHARGAVVIASGSPR
jgi:ADP-heptose:LPS heptosyltransferase